MTNTLKRNIIGIIIIISIFCNVILILIVIAKDKYFDQKVKSFVMKIDANSNIFIKDLSLLSQNISINWDSINISDKKRSQLIYTYSGEECDKCILQDIDALKKRLNSNNVNDVLVLPVLENTRNVNISLYADLSGIQYKRLNKGLVIFPYQDGIQRRFFAILTPTKKVLLPFFPNVNFPERTNSYLDFVFSKYLINSKSSVDKHKEE